MTLHIPATEAEAQAVVAEARAACRPLALRGGGTRAGLGRPSNAVDVLSSAGLAGITLYEPSELVIGARAGTPVRVLEETLAARGQRLPVEPADHRQLYGAHPAGEPTVGGLVATNASGPRRFASGAVRDHLIGLRFVNGRGEAIKSGGRVMKNVTGLDLVKLQCGAHGTLGFLTEACFKVLPVAETVATLALHGLDDARAVAALTLAVGTPFEMTGAAHLPAFDGRPALTLLRFEGFSASVEDRARRLAALLAEFGPAERLAADEAPWDDLRDGVALGAAPDDAVWRVSVAPTRGPGVAARLARVARRHCFDWSGGLLWLATDPAGDAGAALVRAAVAEVGGHATLLRAPDAVRAVVDVFEPLAPALKSVTAAIKASFDPDALFNPGRMYGGV